MNNIETIVSQYANIPASSTDSTGADFLADMERFRVTAANPTPEPVPVVSIHGIPICTRQSISMLSGPSKGGKTAITSVISAGAIATSNGYDGCEFIEVHHNEDLHAILHVDTEQSIYHHYRNHKNSILKRARIEREPEHFYSYNIRSLNLNEYRDKLQGLFNALKEKHGGIHLVIIDGVADFITSPNDEAEANGIVDFFGHLATNFDTTIILVLHLNPGTDKERGHLGSQLQRKCESVLTISKDKGSDISVLEAKILRSGGNSDFSPIRYQFDKSKGYHTFLEGSAPIQAKNTNLVELAKAVFTEQITAGEAHERIMNYEGVAIRKAKQLLSEIYKLDLVENVRDGKYTNITLKSTSNEADDSTPF